MTREQIYATRLINLTREWINKERGSERFVVHHGPHLQSRIIKNNNGRTNMTGSSLRRPIKVQLTLSDAVSIAD